MLRSYLCASVAVLLAGSLNRCDTIKFACATADITCNPALMILYTPLASLLSEDGAAASQSIPAGTLDLSFGGGQGYSVRDLSGAGYSGEGGAALAVNASNGNYVALSGGVLAGLNRVLVFEFSADGTPNTAFNSGIGYHDLSPCVQNHYPTGNGITVQPDGKILISGSMDFCAGGFESTIFRLNTDGTTDTSFGGTCGPGCTPNSSGRFRYDQGGGNNLSGKLILNGDGTMFQLACGDVGGSPMDFTIFKLTSTGILDTSWGGGTGRWFQNDVAGGNGEDRGSTGALDSAGNMWMGGFSYGSSATNDLGIIRVNSTGGALDTNWNGTGLLSMDAVAGFASGDVAPAAMVVDGLDRLVVLASPNNGTNSDIVVLRFNWNGTLDTTFASSGKLLIDNGGNDTGNDLILDGQGRLLISGSMEFSGNQDAVLLRYNSDGALDTTFGSGGMFRTGHATGADFFSGLILDSQNRITIVGQLFNGVDADQAVWRIYN